jgi:ABC-2 type transport system permease protein
MLKIRSTRTTLGLVTAMVALVLLVVVLTGFLAKSSELTSAAGQRTILGFGSLAILFAALAGALLVTGEYRYGTIRPTMLATPRRGQVVLAKLLASALAGLTFGLVAEGLGFLVGWLILNLRTIPMALSGSEVVLLVGGTVAGAVLWGTLGVSLGLVVRSQVGAMLGVLAWILVVEPLVFGLVPAVGRWLPGQAVNALSGVTTAHLLAPTLGGLVLAAWAAVLGLVGAKSLARRDVT